MGVGLIVTDKLLPVVSECADTYNEAWHDQDL